MRKYKHTHTHTHTQRTNEGMDTFFGVLELLLFISLAIIINTMTDTDAGEEDVLFITGSVKVLKKEKCFIALEC